MKEILIRWMAPLRLGRSHGLPLKV